MDVARLRQSSRAYADQVFHLTCAVLAVAIVETLHDPAQSAQVREMTKLRIDLLRFGGAAEDYQEECV